MSPREASLLSQALGSVRMGVSVPVAVLLWCLLQIRMLHLMQTGSASAAVGVSPLPYIR